MVERAPALRVVAIGMSLGPTCGVHDHARLLAGALEREDVHCSLDWLARERTTLSGARAEVRAWSRALTGRLRASGPDAVLLHYSIFAHSQGGFPTFVPPLLAGPRRARVPLVGFMHELAYPWGLGGARGVAWALAQRAALIEAVRRSSSIVVTTDFRAEWLASRRWLPRRPVRVAPVFSNLPESTARPRGDRDCPLLGVFGYSIEPHAIALVLDAVARLRAWGIAVELALLGAPGRDSPLGQSWTRAAAARGLGSALSFVGPLPARELADALAGCDVLLFADGAGPSSRKGSLAGALASGRAVIAIDGPRTWSALRAADAAWVVAAEVDAVADAVAELLRAEPVREALGERGRAFAGESMGLALSARVAARALREALAEKVSRDPRSVPH